MVTMANKDMIFIRDTRTGVSALMHRRMLDHPHYAEFFEEVESGKPVISEMQKPRKARNPKPENEVIVIDPAPVHLPVETEDE